MPTPLAAASSQFVRRLLAVALLMGGLGSRISIADNQPLSEDRIKAAFLFSFTKFVQWPARSFGGADDPIAIGVYCAAPFAESLRTLVDGRKVNGRALVVTDLHATGEAVSSNVVFVCAEADAQFPAILADLVTTPVLTVGESDSAAAHAAVIRFIVDGDKVRFEINMSSAERAGLQVSSQLQKLATAVTRAP